MNTMRSGGEDRGLEVMPGVIDAAGRLLPGYGA
jgi:hypothetical protein